ncbi:MAG: hypothetical protein JWO58_2317 [Chitinophagaceae bacterium]|nr:hypothetical protein [Chitinophagaceae bacterium]
MTMKTTRVFFYILLSLVSLAYLFAGGTKAFAFPEAIALNSTLHIQKWFIRLIGLFELLGAVGLWLPRFRTTACVCLSIIMVGAIGCHVGANQLPNIGPATLLFFLLGGVILLDPHHKITLQPLK